MNNLYNKKYLLNYTISIKIIKKKIISIKMERVEMFKYFANLSKLYFSINTFYVFIFPLFKIFFTQFIIFEQKSY